MKSLRLLVLSVLFLAGLLAGTAQAASFHAIDNDKDGTIDLSEVKAVASRRFDQLDRKRTGTLTRAQLGRLRVNRDEFAAADPDNDGTLILKTNISPLLKSGLTPSILITKVH